MSDATPLAVESSANDNGQNEEPEVTILLQHPGVQVGAEGKIALLILIDSRASTLLLYGSSSTLGTFMAHYLLLVRRRDAARSSAATNTLARQLGYCSHSERLLRPLQQHIVLDDDAAASETTYMAEGVLLAAVTDPRTKTLELLPE